MPLIGYHYDPGIYTIICTMLCSCNFHLQKYLPELMQKKQSKLQNDISVNSSNVLHQNSILFFNDSIYNSYLQTYKSPEKEGLKGISIQYNGDSVCTKHKNASNKCAEESELTHEMPVAELKPDSCAEKWIAPFTARKEYSHNGEHSSDVKVYVVQKLVKNCKKTPKYLEMASEMPCEFASEIQRNQHSKQRQNETYMSSSEEVTNEEDVCSDITFETLVPYGDQPEKGPMHNVNLSTNADEKTSQTYCSVQAQEGPVICTRKEQNESVFENIDVSSSHCMQNISCESSDSESSFSSPNSAVDVTVNEINKRGDNFAVCSSASSESSALCACNAMYPHGSHLPRSNRFWLTHDVVLQKAYPSMSHTPSEPLVSNCSHENDCREMTTLKEYNVGFPPDVACACFNCSAKDFQSKSQQSTTEESSCLVYVSTALVVGRKLICNDACMQQYLIQENKDRIENLAKLFHCHNHQQIFPLSYDGSPPLNFPPEIQILYMFTTGLAYHKLSHYSKGMHYFQKCLKLAEKCGRNGDITHCCIFTGDIEFSQKNYIKASDYYQRALSHYSQDSVADAIGVFVPTLSVLWAKCGSAYSHASHFQNSIAAYQEAVAKAQSKKDELTAHTNLGYVYQDIRSTKSSRMHFEHAVEIANELHIAGVECNEGDALHAPRRGEPPNHQQEMSVIDIGLKFENIHRAIAQACNDLGTTCQSLHEYDNAERYYLHALREFVSGHDVEGQARVHVSLGDIRIVKRKYDRAVRHYTKVIRLSQDKSVVALAHCNRGNAYYFWAEKKSALLQNLQLQETAISPQCNSDSTSHLTKIYAQAAKDFGHFIEYHEEELRAIKACKNELSLSASLFDANRCIFQRMQDCLVRLDKSNEALFIAEQTRARMCGELLLERRSRQLYTLRSPLSTDQLKSIVVRQNCPVVYLSCTEKRLLGWIFYPTYWQSSSSKFEVPISCREFDGQSFHTYLRNNLKFKKLFEDIIDVYQPFKLNATQNNVLLRLYSMFSEHIMRSLQPMEATQKIILIPDSCTSSLPFTCFMDQLTGTFWGDQCYFQIYPSILTMGILEQLPTISVSIPVEYKHSVCVVGNPNIHTVMDNETELTFGHLPYATKEAQFVSHLFNCNPILHECAIKESIVMRMIEAKVIHIATHGDADSLGFAPMSFYQQTVNSRDIFLYPHEIEKLTLSAALVVLSSCHSGSDTVGEDELHGMNRAFLLAGAHTVLTTLWEIPDESACIFMQFFYQYLVDELRVTMALHKAILSMRCFSRYSNFIHWGGYKLTGRDVQFSINRSPSIKELTIRMGHRSIFPQLEIIQQLQMAFLHNPKLPTNVQVT